jgi:hypothetical protein
MLSRIIKLAGLGLLAVAIIRCGGGGPDAAENPTAARVTLNEHYAGALPISSQLTIGTLLLEGTEDAITEEQAGELLTNYQMLQALQASGTAAQAELDAVLDQIQEAMTDEQLAEIKDMQLTADSRLELVQERGLGRGLAGGSGAGGGFRPPEGALPGGGGGPGGGFGGLGGLGGGDLDPEERQAALAERLNQSAGTIMTGALISLLEARAAGEDWQATAPDRDFGLQRTVFGALAEATGLEPQAMMAQIGEGQTLADVAAENGTDVEAVVAQVVAAETGRVEQAVADGSMGRSDADAWLADLEARVREILQQPLQFRGSGGLGDSSGQP